MIEKNALEKRVKKSVSFHPLLAFFVTMFSLILVFLINQIVPFGQRNVLTYDLGSQYAPFLLGLKHSVTGGGSVLYSRNIGMGSSTIGIFAYYLSSPLNILTLVFPDSMIQELVSVLTILKLSFAGAFMTWLLERKFSSRDRMSVLFGMMYPFCTYAIAFMFNIMWLDGFALLPLVILLIEEFIKERRRWPLLTLSFFLLFVSGYYMAYMVGVFSFIYIVSVMAYQGKFKKEQNGLQSLGLFLLSAVTAALMSACILLPAGVQTLNNPDASVQESVFTMQPEFKLMDMVDQLVEKGAGNIIHNMPLVFCGMTALFLCVLFFLNPKIKRSLKIAIGAAFGFGILCFQFPLLKLAWHLFDVPNCFDYRYSYLFSFVMILVAYYSYLNMQYVSKKHFFTALGIVFAMSILSQNFGKMAEADSTYFATAIFTILICVLLYGKTLEKWPESIANLKNLGAGLLATVIVVEIVVFNPRCLMPDIYADLPDASKFSGMITDIRTLSDRIGDSDEYRTELHQPWYYLIGANNLPFYSGLRGISFFATMTNRKTAHFLKQMGYDVLYNYASCLHNNVILAPDSLFGVKYIITKSEDLSGLELISEENGIKLYKNQYAFPEAFLIRSDANSFDGFALEKDDEVKDYFSFQENWFNSLSGEDASDLYDTFTVNWKPVNGQLSVTPPEKAIVPADTVENRLNNESRDLNAKGLKLYLRDNAQYPFRLQSEVIADRDGVLYLEIPYLHCQCSTDVYLNGKPLYTGISDSDYTRVLYLGDFSKGDRVDVEIRCNEDLFACFEPIFAYSDPEGIEKQKNVMTAGMHSIMVDNGHYEIEVDAKEDSVLLITAPYEKGWTACVDGNEAEITAYQDAFLSVPVSAGAHKVELKFTPPGLRAGIAASAAGVLAFVFISVFLTRKKGEKKQRREDD